MDKFLFANNSIGGSNNNFSNGTSQLHVQSVRIANLDPSKALKTNAVQELISSNLDIADVNNLQTELDSVVRVPYLGTFQASDYRSEDFASLNQKIAEIDTHITSSDGKHNDISTDISNLQSDIDDLKDVSTTNATNINNLITDVNNLENKTQYIDTTTGTTNFTVQTDSTNNSAPVELKGGLLVRKKIFGNEFYNLSDEKLATEVYVNTHGVHTDVSDLQTKTQNQSATAGQTTFVGQGVNSLIVKTTDNSLPTGISFQNSGTTYVSTIQREVAGANRGNLVFRVGLPNLDPALLDEKMRIEHDAGLKMSAIIDMNNNKITNLADPTDAGDVVNKQWVESHTSAGTADAILNGGNTFSPTIIGSNIGQTVLKGGGVSSLMTLDNSNIILFPLSNTFIVNPINSTLLSTLNVSNTDGKAIQTTGGIFASKAITSGQSITATGSLNGFSLSLRNNTGALTMPVDNGNLYFQTANGYSKVIAGPRFIEQRFRLDNASFNNYPLYDDEIWTMRWLTTTQEIEFTSKFSSQYTQFSVEHSSGGFITRNFGWRPLSVGSKVYPMTGGGFSGSHTGLRNAFTKIRMVGRNTAPCYKIEVWGGSDVNGYFQISRLTD
jgi:hypothetical protein